MLLTASINMGEIGHRSPYIYGIVALEFPALYIGQTLSAIGALGRLAQHLSSENGNTLRKRIADAYNYAEIELGPIEFAAFKLPDRTEFSNRVPDYREAVEALVQYSILDKMIRNDLACPVISRVAFNPLTSQHLVKIQAGYATEELFGWACSFLI
ncbi:hypothetical protein AB0I81_15930 [Nonomuraea sp. NPDC050404]|uniref:hypothetical protein n=1 Tax=Nonomuraea sp. NPDC050404 TaxID=3155783 RepID=UPI0033EEAFB9